MVMDASLIPELAPLLNDLKRSPSKTRLFPLPLPARPIAPTNKASRSRHRHAKRMMLWLAMEKYVCTLNVLHSGQPRSQPPPATSVVSEAQRLALDRIRIRCQQACRERRDSCLTGAHAAHTLIKSCAADLYGTKVALAPQVNFVSERITEPPPDSPTVVMLEALPQDERQYCENEEAVKVTGGVVPELIQEVEQ